MKVQKIASGSYRITTATTVWVVNKFAELQGWWVAYAENEQDRILDPMPTLREVKEYLEIAP